MATPRLERRPGGRPFQALGELLRYRARLQPAELAVVFLTEGELEAEEITYGLPDQLARRIGAWLQARDPHTPGVRPALHRGPALYRGVLRLPLCDRHQKLLSTMRQAFLPPTYLWPVNRELGLMAAGASILKSLPANRRCFEAMSSVFAQLARP